MSKSIWKQDLNNNTFFIRLMILGSVLISLTLLFWILTEGVCQFTGKELTANVESVGSRKGRLIDYTYILDGKPHTDTGRISSNYKYVPGDTLIIRRVDVLPEIFGTEETCIKDSMTRTIIFCVWLLMSVGFGMFYEFRRRMKKTEKPR